MEKKYVIALNFNKENYTTYIKVCEDCFKLMLDPSSASEFKTSTEALNCLRNNTDLDEYCNIVSKDDAIVEFNDWKAKGMVISERELVNNNISKKYNGETPDEILKWWINYCKSNSRIRHSDYRTWPKLYSVFEYIFDTVKYSYIENDYSFSLRFDKVTSNFESFVKEFNKIKDVATHKNPEGYTVFEIFNRDLNETRTSKLLYKSFDHCIVEEGFSSNVYGTLEQCFNFLKNERYYTDNGE